jgi:hypothetical protein
MRDPEVNLSTEALAICQVLLNHQRSLLRAAERPPFKQCLLTYRDVCEGAGLPLLIQSVSTCLWEIAEFCADNEWPPLNALVVNSKTFEPGKVYDKAPGCSLKTWREEAQCCLDYAHYPDLLTA